MHTRLTNILLIDANDIDAKLVSKMLESSFDEAYSLTVKKNLQKGIAFFNKEPVDLILLDLYLPDSTVDETFEFLDNYEKKFPFIILSTINDKHLRIKAIQKGAQDFLVKNEFDGPLLSRSINYSIERHQLHKKLHDYANELKDKEQKLIESQAIAQIGNFEINPKNKVIYWSKEALQLLEINNGGDSTTVDKFLNRVGDEKEYVAKLLGSAVKDKMDFNTDITIKMPDKKIRYFNMRIRSHLSDRHHEIVGTIQDITQRKEIESALKASEEKYHRLFQDSRDAIYITTEEGKFIDFNQATIDLFGYTEEELQNIEVSQLYLNPFEREKTKKAIAEKGFVRDFELKLKKKDGTKLDCVISSTIWRSLDYTQSGFQGIIRDITEQKRTDELIRNKEIAERSSRLKQRFLANMSHEIRTPINAIAGLTHLILQMELSDKHKEYLEGIKTSSEHLLALVNDILDYSKIEEGKIEFEAMEFDLHEHLIQLINSLQYAAERKGLKLLSDFDDGIPQGIVGDPIRLNQIIINLLSNAIKFTDKGHVKVVTSLIEDGNDAVVVSLKVEDTGIGIPPNKLKTIFRSFTQLGRNITKTAEGTGLGLAITKQLVELQGGTISVQSEENGGSLFEVTLMFKKELTEAQRKQKEKKNAIVKNIGFKKILIVEDKKLNQLVTSEMLKSKWRNVEVDVADNGEQAVDRLKQKSYDLILMDVQMPVMDGYETTRYIRTVEQKSDTKVPILAMTAYNTTGEAEKCIEAGMDDYIAKPFQPNELYQKIVELIYHKTPDIAKNGNLSKSLQANEHLNLDYLHSVAGGNSGLKHKIIDLLIEETPVEIQKLKEYTDQENWDRVRAFAHKLKSSLTYLGLNHSLQVVKEVEEFADSRKHLDRIPKMVEQVTAACSRALNELKATQEV